MIICRFERLRSSCHTAAITAGACSSKLCFIAKTLFLVLVQPHFTGDARSLDANDLK